MRDVQSQQPLPVKHTIIIIVPLYRFLYYSNILCIYIYVDVECKQQKKHINLTSIRPVVLWLNYYYYGPCIIVSHHREFTCRAGSE